MNANLTRNWAPLAGLVSRGFKLIDLPIPELYDLGADPAERTNLYARRQDLAKPLELQLDALRADAGAATPSPVDRDTVQRLRSLGYVVAPTPRPARSFTARDDPKTLVTLNNRLDEALDGLRTGAPEAAERILKELIAARPDFTVAYDRLAQLYRDTGRMQRAIATLEAASRDGVADATSAGGRQLRSIRRGAAGGVEAESQRDGRLREAGSDIHANGPIRGCARDVRSHAVGRAELRDNV